MSEIRGSDFQKAAGVVSDEEKARARAELLEELEKLKVSVEAPRQFPEVEINMDVFGNNKQLVADAVERIRNYHSWPYVYDEGSEEATKTHEKRRLRRKELEEKYGPIIGYGEFSRLTHENKMSIGGLGYPLLGMVKLEKAFSKGPALAGLANQLVELRVSGTRLFDERQTAEWTKDEVKARVEKFEDICQQYLQMLGDFSRKQGKKVESSGTSS